MRVRLQPSLPGFLFLILALLLLPLAAHPIINADGDPARHVRHGETILRRHDVLRVEQFTFTHAGKPFVGFEYASQVALALSHRLGGTTGMAALAALLIAGSLTMIAAWLMGRGVEPVLVVLCITVVAILTGIHWLARPHLFSWPFMLLLLFWLESKKRPPVWAFLLLFLAWTNLHGSFVFGWIMLGFYLAGHLVESFWTRDVEARQRERSAVFGLIPVLLLVLPLALVNPYGWGVPKHVLGFLQDRLVQSLSQEFQSPNFLVHDQAFLLALTGTMLILAVRPRLRWTHIMVIAGTAGAALISGRNIVQFGLLAVPLLTLAVAKPWGRSMRRLGAIQRFEASARSGATAPYIGLGIVFLLILSLNRGQLGGRQLVQDGFEPARFPVEAVAWARQNNVKGRIFNEMFWGGYLVYAWPENPVFIDGGVDFYGGEFFRSYRHVTALQPGWRDSLAAWRIDHALVPRGSALGHELLLSPAWHPIHCDGTALLLTARAGETDPVSRSDCASASGRPVAER